jgi:hypothetical protein
MEAPWSMRGPLAAVFASAVVVGVGLSAAPERTLLNLIVCAFYILSLSASAMFFLSSQLLSGAAWSAGLRRVGEALMLLLPLAAGMTLALLAGRHLVYPAAAEFGHEAAGRTFYLSPFFVFARAALTFGAWGAFAWCFRRASLAQDLDRRSSVERHRSLVRYAGAFVVVFAPSFTVMSYDWLLALEPRWFSTMFAVYAFAGAFVQGTAAITLAVLFLRRDERFAAAVKPARLHDLGKLLFAFSTFWAYIWLCQYLLVWYGDIPEEIAYYARRTNGPWLFFFALDVVVNWLVPFVLLMSARAKRSPRVLFAVSSLLLAGHWLDLYVMVMPSKWAAPRLGILEMSMPVFCASLSYLVFVHTFFRVPVVPMHDPLLAAEGHADG